MVNFEKFLRAHAQEILRVRARKIARYARAKVTKNHAYVARRARVTRARVTFFARIASLLIRITLAYFVWHYKILRWT